MTTASLQIADEHPIAVTSTTAPAGFAELYERHYEAVFRAALRVTGNPADAEDVLQTVFLRVFSRGGGMESLRKYDRGIRLQADSQGPAEAGPHETDQGLAEAGPHEADRGPAEAGPHEKEVLSQALEPALLPAAYFRRAAVNAAVDLLRRRAVHAESVYDDRAPHAAVQHPSLLKEQLRRAIATLEKDDASLFLLRHVEGLSIEELAVTFQLEKNNVAVRLHRIRHRLQAEMER